MQKFIQLSLFIILSSLSTSALSTKITSDIIYLTIYLMISFKFDTFVKNKYSSQLWNNLTEAESVQ